jgi:hypothetical protein
MFLNGLDSGCAFLDGLNVGCVFPNGLEMNGPSLMITNEISNG